MAREIKFRVWDTTVKEFILYWCGDIRDDLNRSFADNRYVFQQYTGLKDKNGKEIYEGDVIELDDYGRGTVVFDEGMFQYWPLAEAWKIEEDVKCTAFYPITSAVVEVIGNIYENPELLK